SWRIYKVTSSILEVFGFGHLKTSPSWGEVPFLCPKILTAQGLRLLQNAHLKIFKFRIVILRTISYYHIYDNDSHYRNYR
ncbi:hypothetical protein P9H28_07905, partial [Paenibacillus barengoltzii]|uniref:hypothetical protein n=1 Tax=Paenibacillus barengoltzii TaxID=343517 RepID=UPI002DBE1993